MGRITGLLVICIWIISIAGPNEEAILYVDFSANTEAIDSMGECPEESTIVTAIRIDGASKLFSYEFYINFDTSSLQFVSGKKGTDDNGNFLEKNNGSVFFTAKRSIHDSTRILIGCSLTGDVSSECASESGLLGLITFRHRRADTTQLLIDSVKLLDCVQTLDAAISCYSGKIVPSTGIPVTHFRERVKGSPHVAIANGSINVEFNKKTDYVLTIVNTLGKKLYSNKGYTDRIMFDGRKEGSLPRSSSLVVVRICYSGSELVVPLLR